MKKKILKKLICLFVVASALIGGISVYADTIETPDIVEITPVVNSLDVTKGEDSLIIDFEGIGTGFKVYINNVLYDTYTNSVEDSEYSEKIIFKEYAPGVTYTFKIVPYNKYDTVGGAESAKIEIDALKISEVSVSDEYDYSYDDKGYSTGYRKPAVLINASVDNFNKNYEQIFQIFRSTKENSGYKKIDTIITSSGNISYKDNTVIPEKTYYYKVKPVSKADNLYFKSNKYGKESKTYSCKVGLGITKFLLDYNNDVSISINMDECYPRTASGYEIYRSMEKKTGYEKIAVSDSRKYIDKDVKRGGTYYYKVRAYYYDIDTGKKYFGDYSSPAAIKALFAELNLKGKQTGNRDVTLTWERVKGVSECEVYYKTDIKGDGYKRLTSTSKTEIEINGLKEDTGYYFMIKTFSSAKSLEKYHIMDTIHVNMGFDAPQNFKIDEKTVTTTGAGATFKIKLKWDKVYGATGYRIEGCANGKYTTIKKLNKGTTTDYTFTNTYTKDEGSKYSDIRILALNGSEESSPSYISKGISTLNKVSGIKVNKNSNTSAKITWNKVVGATKYNIYRYTPMGDSVLVGSSSSTSFVDKKAICPGLKYKYYVEAVNTKLDLKSNPSNAAYTHKLGTTTISYVKNSSSKTAVIKWAEVVYGKEYIVYRSTSKNGTYKKVATTSKLTYTDSGLTKGKTYYYKIAIQTTNYAGITVTSAQSSAKWVKIEK